MRSGFEESARPLTDAPAPYGVTGVPDCRTPPFGRESINLRQKPAVAIQARQLPLLIGCGGDGSTPTTPTPTPAPQPTPAPAPAPDVSGRYSGTDSTLQVLRASDNFQTSVQLHCADDRDAIAGFINNERLLAHKFALRAGDVRHCRNGSSRGCDDNSHQRTEATTRALPRR